MIFNSFQFLWLFPCIFALYYGASALCGQRLHGRIANLLLLVISYGVYMQWNVGYSMVLMWVTAATYVGARLFDAFPRLRRVWVLWVFLVLGLAPLLVFKYYDFMAGSLNSLLPPSSNLPGLNWAIPLGLSFYTFQAIGYLCDVYKQRVEAERNVWDYALFVAFFPQILCGPISRADELLPQIKQTRAFDYAQAVSGLRFLLWGMFLKVVIADRLGIYVDSVYGNLFFQSGLTCLLAMVMYSFQIYCDFAGYSLMAVGVGCLMGFNLVQNFRRPYLAVSVTDFWRRWHISLTRWLTTHVYIALGGNRCSQGRQYFNIMITFLVSGFWHGAAWTFVGWGLLHGIFQIAEKALGWQKADANGSRVVRMLRMVGTFLLVSVAWVLFRAPCFDDAYLFLSKIFLMSGSGIFLPSNSVMGFILISMFILGVKEIGEEYYPQFSLMAHPQRAVRWGTYIVLCTLILLLGVFDAGQFIYVQF